MGAAALNKTYHINLTIKMTRGPGEIDFAKGEVERLHNLLGADSPQTDWAKIQIETITRMVLLPNAEDIRPSIEKKLAESDEQEA